MQAAVQRRAQVAQGLAACHHVWVGGNFARAKIVKVDDWR
jgi:hypothetical protein